MLIAKQDLPSIERGEVEGCLLAAVFDVGVGAAAIDKDADDLGVAVLGGAVQRRLLVRVLQRHLVHQCLLLQK